MTVEQEIEDRVAEEMRLHTLRQAGKQIGEVRAQLRNIEFMLSENGSPEIAKAVRSARDNQIDGIRNKIEFELNPSLKR